MFCCIVKLFDSENKITNYVLRPSLSYAVRFFNTLVLFITTIDVIINTSGSLIINYGSQKIKRPIQN